MTTYTIIGTGNMGTAIGNVLAAGGADVTHLAHAEVANATISADIVVLAVPYSAVDEIIAAVGDQLAGNTVVDITNPLNFETFDSLVVPEGSSATAQIQARLPKSSVLKAFNTNFAATLSSKTVGDATTTVLVAGDDAAAKAALIESITAGGIGAIDAGSLARAHELEAMGFLQLTLAANEHIGWTAGFAVAK
jgi:predicted dinucleotide-binding enzyme